MSRSVERVLEEAHLSGDLKLNGRKLKEFPSSDKYDLHDTVYAGKFTQFMLQLERVRFFNSIFYFRSVTKSILRVTCESYTILVPRTPKPIPQYHQINSRLHNLFAISSLS